MVELGIEVAFVSCNRLDRTEDLAALQGSTDISNDIIKPPNRTTLPL